MSRITPDNWDFSRSRFVAYIVSDYQTIANTARIDVSNMVKAASPDIILSAGDTSDANNFAASMAIYQAFVDRGLFFPAPGNHDQTTAMGVPDYCQSFFQYYTYLNNQYYYVLSLGALDVFFLNSHGLNPDGYVSSSRMGTWLSAMLASSTALWKIALLHYPPFSSGNVHGSTIPMQWPQFSGMDAVFSGHDHIYERILVGDTYYFVNGMGGSNNYGFISPPVTGSQFRFNTLHGAMRLEVAQSRMNLRFIDTNSNIVDEIELTK
jgi:tartrate-resistant acid phosphatase type 5